MLAQQQPRVNSFKFATIKLSTFLPFLISSYKCAKLPFVYIHADITIVFGGGQGSHLIQYVADSLESIKRYAARL